jgi:CBS domain-containing protein
MRVRDIMTTALITMRSNETIGQADDDMRVADIRHIPVIDDRGRLVGIVSNRDLFRAIRRGNKDAVAVADIMSRSLHTLTEDAPAYRATELMLEHKIGAVPILGDDGHLVGLVTETDLLRVADRALRQKGER